MKLTEAQETAIALLVGYIWELAREPEPDLTGMGRVRISENTAKRVVQDIVKNQVEQACVLIYAKGYDKSAPVAVADVCDTVLDKSGALLGRVREQVRKLEGDK